MLYAGSKVHNFIIWVKVRQATTPIHVKVAQSNYWALEYLLLKILRYSKYSCFKHIFTMHFKWQQSRHLIHIQPMRCMRHRYHKNILSDDLKAKVASNENLHRNVMESKAQYLSFKRSEVKVMFPKKIILRLSADTQNIQATWIQYSSNFTFYCPPKVLYKINLPKNSFIVDLSICTNAMSRSGQQMAPFLLLHILYKNQIRSHHRCLSDCSRKPKIPHHFTGCVQLW